MTTDLVKIALDSGCAYLPPGENIEPLYIFSLKELTQFAALREALENNKLSDVTLINEGDMAQPKDHSEQDLNMVQGEWVDLTDDEVDMVIDETYGESPELYVTQVRHDFANEVIAKFKEKNTPPVVPQEPVAWMYKFKTEDPILCKVKRDWADNHSQWKETPLYTTPPSSQRADVLVKATYNKGYDEAVEFIEATNYLEANIKSAVEAAIEATKEKAAKVCENVICYHKGVAKLCAAAIRSMK